MSRIITRRSFLQGGAGLLVGGLWRPCFGLATQSLDRRLSLHNIHTGEFFRETIVQNGKIVPEVMILAQHFLRDHRTQQTHPMHPDLLELVSKLQQDCSAPGRATFDVISGYRSVETNAMLHKKNRGVARHSYHTKGHAMDIRLPKYLKELRRLALSYAQGGVGYYPKSGFLHVDIRAKPASWGRGV